MHASDFFQAADRQRTFEKLTPQAIFSFGGMGAEVLARGLKIHLSRHADDSYPTGIVQARMFDIVDWTEQHDPLPGGLEYSPVYTNLWASRTPEFIDAQRRIGRLDWFDDRLERRMRTDSVGGKGCPMLGRVHLARAIFRVLDEQTDAINNAVTIMRENLDVVGPDRVDPDVVRCWVIAGLSGSKGAGSFIDGIANCHVAARRAGVTADVRLVALLPSVLDDRGTIGERQTRDAVGYAALRELEQFRARPEELISKSLVAAVDPETAADAFTSLPWGLVTQVIPLERAMDGGQRLPLHTDVYDFGGVMLSLLVSSPEGRPLVRELESNAVPALSRVDPVSRIPTYMSRPGLGQMIFPRLSIREHLVARTMRFVLEKSLLDDASHAGTNSNAAAHLRRQLVDLPLRRLRAEAAKLGGAAQPPDTRALRRVPRRELHDSVTRAATAQRNLLAGSRRTLQDTIDAAGERELDEAVHRVRELADRAAEGLPFVAAVLGEVQLYALECAHAEREKYTHATDRCIALDDAIAGHRGRLLRKRQTATRVATDLEERVHAERRALEAEAVVGYLEALAGVTVEDEMRGEVITQRMRRRSLLDVEIAWIRGAIRELQNLLARMSRRETQGLVGAERATTATAIFVPNGAENPAQCEAVGEVWQLIAEPGVGAVAAQALRGAQERLAGEALIAAFAQGGSRASDAAAALEAAAAVVVNDTGSAFLRRDVIQVARDEWGDERLELVLTTRLPALATPLVPVNDAIVSPALALVRAEVCAVPNGYKGRVPTPALAHVVESDDDSRVSLLVLEHGVTIRALQSLPKMRAAYRPLAAQARLGATSVHHPLHIDRRFNEAPDEALPNIEGRDVEDARARLGFTLMRLLDEQRADSNGHAAVPSPLTHDGSAYILRSGALGPDGSVSWHAPVRIDDGLRGVWLQVRPRHELHELAIGLFAAERRRDAEWAQAAIAAHLAAVELELPTATDGDREVLSFQRAVLQRLATESAPSNGSGGRA